MAGFCDVNAREVIQYGADAHGAVHEPHVPLTVLHAHLLETSILQLQRLDAFQARFSVE